MPDANVQYSKRTIAKNKLRMPNGDPRYGYYRD